EKARFNHPQGIVAAEDGTIYIADTGNHSVRKLANGQVTTLISAGETPEAPVQPRGMLLQGSTLIVTDLFAQNLLFADTAEKAVYLDIPNGAWYAEAVQKVAERGIVSGTGDGYFTPDAPVTRGMFAAMLSRLHQSVDGSAVIDGDAAFTDVSSDAWFAPAARWAADQRIIVGDNGGFLPNVGITREALAAILYRYAGGMGYDVSARANLNGFSDTETVSSYAMDAVSWAVAQGILNGSDGALQPKNVATRAETAKMLVAFMDAMEI
ncbi:MAG: S-layer homology domain-containing protein, partial [Anaerotignum sp.]